MIILIEILPQLTSILNGILRGSTSKCERVHIKRGYSTVFLDCTVSTCVVKREKAPKKKLFRQGGIKV